jgi:hypothetical protein
MEALTCLLDTVVHHAVQLCTTLYMVTVARTAEPVALLSSCTHLPSACEVYVVTHTRWCWCTSEVEHTRGTRPHRSVPSLAWHRVFARSVASGCSHQLYRCGEGCRRDACWRVFAACGSHLGGKMCGKPSDRTGLVRGDARAEGVVSDRCGGRIVHGSVPGCSAPTHDLQRGG